MADPERRPVRGWSGFYEVDATGTIYSLSRVILRRNGVPKTIPGGVLHQAVLMAFVGERPEGHEACHNDGNPANNVVANLRWDTRASNAADAVRHGRVPRGDDHYTRKRRASCR